MTQGQFFSRHEQIFFFWTGCYTKVKELSLPYYLPIAGFTPFLQVLREMQTASSRTKNRVTVSIAYDDNHYTTCAHAEKGKTKRYMLVYLMIYFILLCRRVSTSKFLSEYKNMSKFSV